MHSNSGETHGLPRHSRLGGGHWRPFEEAREFVRTLGLKSSTEWNQYLKTGDKPNDIPTSPPQVYSEEWVSWRDWLGGRPTRGDWRPFEEAREFARGLEC